MKPTSNRQGRDAARVIVACLLASVFAGCKAPPQATPSRKDVQPEVQKELIEAHMRLIKAFQDHDVEAFVALLDPSSELLIFHPVARDRFSSIEEVRSQLPAMFERLGEVTWTDVHPMVIQRGDIAWVTSNVLMDSPNLSYHFVGRGTEIWVHDGGAWRLIHGHWSPQPDGS